MSKTYLGVDIGGTAVKLGLVDENGRVLRLSLIHISVPWPTCCSMFHQAVRASAQPGVT